MPGDTVGEGIAASVLASLGPPRDDGESKASPDPQPGVGRARRARGGCARCNDSRRGAPAPHLATAPASAAAPPRVQFPPARCHCELPEQREGSVAIPRPSRLPRDCVVAAARLLAMTTSSGPLAARKGRPVPLSLSRVRERAGERTLSPSPACGRGRGRGPCLPLPRAGEGGGEDLVFLSSVRERAGERTLSPSPACGRGRGEGGDSGRTSLHPRLASPVSGGVSGRPSSPSDVPRPSCAATRCSWVRLDGQPV